MSGEGFPDWLEPMAATLTQERFTTPEWRFERKLDGIRLIAFKNGDQSQLLSRNRLPQHLPAIAAAITALPVHNLVLDGEVIRGADGGFHVFDILWIDGRDVTAEPLEQRLALLAQLPLDPPLHRVPALEDPSPWELACREGWEGVIAKRCGSTYEHRRSPHWLKMKCEISQALAVGGFTDPQGSRVGLGALLVGYFDADDFVFAGKIGTGFNTTLLLDLRARLDGLEIPSSPFTRATGLPRLGAHWVRPADRGRRRVHRMDVPRQAPPSTLAPGAVRSAGARGREGHPVITHPDKVLFPDDGITKGDLAAYYESVAPLMLPHIKGRPLTMERYPGGIGAKGFWQKDVSKGFPAWLKRVEVAKKDGTLHHPLIGDLRSLLWMTNQNTITPHVWVSRVPKLTFPDVCVFDLDPASDDEPEILRTTALNLRELLTELGLRSWVKTTGSKGFHIVLSLDGTTSTEEVDRFAHAVGRELVARDPDHLTQEFSKADRGGRILVDTGRNGYSATFAAAYAVRARTGAPVSAPVSWEEIESGTVGPKSFTLRTMPARTDSVGDLWSDLRTRKQPIKAAIKKLSRLRPDPARNRT